MANPGIGAGIGYGLEQIGQNLSRRFEIEAFAGLQQREKESDRILQAMDDMAQNRVRLQNNLRQQGISDQDKATLQLQLQDLDNEHQRLSISLKSLYEPHDVPGLFSKIKNWIQRKPQPVSEQRTPYAEFTPEVFKARAPVYEPQYKPYGDVYESGGKTLQSLYDPQRGFIQAPIPGRPTPSTLRKEDLQRQLEDLRRVAKESGWSAEDTRRAEQLIVAGYTAPRPLAEHFTNVSGTVDGQRVTWKQRFSDGAFFDLNDNPIDPGIVARFQRTTIPSGQAQTVTDFEDFATKLYGPRANRTAEQDLDAHRRWTNAGAETIGTHTIPVAQPDGSIKLFEVTTTSRKVLPGTTPQGGISSPGEAKDKIRELGTVGGRKTAAQNKTESEYAQAVKAAAQADRAAKARNSVEDKLLIETLVKAASGRFSQASYENIVGKTGLANKLEQFYNNVLAGGQLPDDVRNQAVQAAHGMVKDAEAAVKALSTVPTGSEDNPIVVRPEDLK